jgi:hypothetical protein
MVMASVVRRLEHLGPEAMATMLASLEAPAQEEILRAATVEAVGKLRDARAVPWLVPLTWKDQPLSVRKSAIGALGRIGTEQAIDAALLATRVEGPGREGLVMALAHARHVRVAHELSGLVRHASDEALAYAAAEALGMVASSYAWATPQRQASGRMPEVQAMAARALVDAYLSRVSASDPLRGAMESALAMVDRGAVDRALDERTLGASASDMERAQGLRRALGTP